MKSLLVAALLGLCAASNTTLPIKAGQHTLTPQTARACATHGEKQWTGTVDVSDERRLFFWYFDSRHSPDTDPVIVWLQGGPGASSMIGLFTESGPCRLPDGAMKTESNPWSWNNNASVLYLEQPAGVGFSTLAPGSPLPSGDPEPAEDFQVFLDIFFTKVFPKKEKLPLHLAAESYGGHYAPTYLQHVIDARSDHSKTAFTRNFTSLILISAVIDDGAPSLGAYELLCQPSHGPPHLNATECATIQSIWPECYRLRQECIDGDDRWGACVAKYDYCQGIDALYTGYRYDSTSLVNLCPLTNQSITCAKTRIAATAASATRRRTLTSRRYSARSASRARSSTRRAATRYWAST